MQDVGDDKFHCKRRLRDDFTEKVGLVSEAGIINMSPTLTTGAIKCLSCALNVDNGRNHSKANHAMKQRRKSTFQRLLTFVVCLSILQLVQSMGSGYGKSVLTSIERRYKLTNLNIGIMQSCFHIGNLSFILFVSYYGSKWHRPRAIAIGSLIMAASSIIATVPQFIGYRYNPVPDSFHSKTSDNMRPANFASNMLAISDSFGDNGDMNYSVNRFVSTFKNDLFSSQESVWKLKNSGDIIAVSSGNAVKVQANDITNISVDTNYTQLCMPYGHKKGMHRQIYLFQKRKEQEKIEDDSLLYLFIAIASFLKGVGHTPLHPLGMSFIDDFAASRNSAMYISVVTAVSWLGPACGFLLGSVTTNIWVDSGWVDVKFLKANPHDPTWVGAWWMGYYVIALLFFIITIPFLMIPRIIPKEENYSTFHENSCLSCMSKCYSDSLETTLKSEDELKVNLPAFGDKRSTEISTSGSGCANSGNLSVVNDSKEDQNTLLFTATNGSTTAAPNIANLPKHCNNNSAQLLSCDSDTLVTKAESAKIKCQLETHCPFQKSLSAPVIDGGTAKSQTCQGLGMSLPTYNSSESCQKRVLLSVSGGIFSPSDNESSLKNFTRILKSLLKDFLFISITFGCVSLSSFLATSATYIVKYMETQFNVTASFANLLNGCVNLPMAVIGNVLGGWTIRRYCFNVKQMIYLVLIGLILAIVATSFLLLIGCEDRIFVGLKAGARPSACVTNCACKEDYQPVCDVTTNITYRSACFAGCRMYITSVDQKSIFYDCRCRVTLDGLMDMQKHSLSNISSVRLHNGSCPRQICTTALIKFVVVMGIVSMAAGITVAPSTLTILRIVPSSIKALAFGIMSAFTRLLAWIPTPAYIGAAIDSSCVLWTSDNSNQQINHQQRCQIYDKQKFRMVLFGSTMLQLIAAFLFYLATLLIVIRRRHNATTLLNKNDGSLVLLDTKKNQGQQRVAKAQCKIIN